MKLRAGDRLLLHQQSGADFDFSANAEGVDALVADRLCGVRPNHLPVIILRSLIDSLDGLPLRREPNEIESAVAVQIGSVKYERGRNQLL